jgi:GT2 family glycosyltransferase
MSDDNGLLASVIVLAYNDKKYLESCLSSLLDQDLPAESYEIIYADNASTDGSADFVKEHFPEVRVLQLEKNYGFAEGNNLAAESAIGKYISFQNADTIAHRQWLPELIKAIESDPNVKACHPAGVPLDLGGYHERDAPIQNGVMCDLTRFGYVDFAAKGLNGDRIATLHLAGGSLLIDPDIHDKLGYYFDPTYFIYNEDTDLGLRINNLGYEILFVSSAACYHQRDASRRTHLNKVSIRNIYLVTRNRFITFYKNMSGLEFLLALPMLFMGSIVKLRTLPMGTIKKIIYGLGLIPLTIFGFVMAVIRFPKYSKNRKYILQNNPNEKFWLLKELWKRGVPPWTPLSIGINTN